MKFKKIVFLFVFLIISFFIFIQAGILKKIFPISEVSVEKNMISSCRTVSQKPFSKSHLGRVEKLNRLMDTAVDWVFKSLNGEVIDLYCLRGEKRLVLNFWATWCPPCIKELSSLAELARDNKDKIFVAAVSTEDKKTVQSFLARSFSDLDSSLVIAVMNEEEKLKRFPKDSLPATYVFNTKGFLKIKELGDRDWSDESIVQSILSLD